MTNHPPTPTLLDTVEESMQANDPLNQYLVELEEAVRLLKRDSSLAGHSGLV